MHYDKLEEEQAKKQQEQTENDSESSDGQGEGAYEGLEQTELNQEKKKDK